MLRVFSSIRKNLLAENKTVRYLKYAVGEVLLIMVGIFLALQLNNWNEGRKDRIEEREIMRRIHVEVTENLSRISGLISTSVRSRENLELVAAAFEKGKASDNVQFLGSVVDSSSFSFATPEQTFPAYEELVNSGKMGLIKNSTLRYLINEYHRTKRLNQKRGDLILGRYGHLTYDLVPRSGGLASVAEFDEESAAIIATSVLNSELHKFIIPQRNRLNFLELIWTRQIERGAEVLTAIEEELSKN